MELKTFRLKNRSGLTCKVTNYGATLMRLKVPNKQGTHTDVVIGLPKAKDYKKAAYQQKNFCMGATIGRYAGRISKGGFLLNETFYPLQNEITLHGGKHGFDKQLWKVVELQERAAPYVLFALESREGAHGFPGNLKVFAKYELDENSLKITYTATTDKPTVLNLTNHSYFNLDGEGSVKENTLFVNSDQLLPLDKQLIPTGKLKNLKNTPYNYGQPTPLHFKNHRELDTPYLLKKGPLQASLYSKKTGIEMQVTTNQPAMVLFTPQDFPPMGLRNNDGFGKYPAICFECQHYPDAPNQPHFPSAVLHPGEEYCNVITYRFAIDT